MNMWSIVDAGLYGHFLLVIIFGLSPRRIIQQKEWSRKYNNKSRSACQIYFLTCSPSRLIFRFSDHLPGVPTPLWIKLKHATVRRPGQSSRMYHVSSNVCVREGRAVGCRAVSRDPNATIINLLWAFSMWCNVLQFIDTTRGLPAYRETKWTLTRKGRSSRPAPCQPFSPFFHIQVHFVTR